ncbi:MAG TPA: hypothetical protein VFL57_12650 [Bryobacteraceae bacterium]|nr:hypothetical protein [Bryobacteraceae bacterium]
MKTNLDTLKGEIESYLVENNFILFRGFSRRLADMPEVEWDTRQYPDYKQFLKVAKQLEARLIVFHHREFAAGLVDDAVDELETRYNYDEDGSIARRLNELRMYEGFTCAVELSFEHEGTLFVFEMHAPWYEEYREICSELDMVAEDEPDEDEPDSTLGGYYSRN